MLTAEDSGSENAPVIYRSAGDGDVRISNSVKLNHIDLAPVTDTEILDKVQHFAIPINQFWNFKNCYTRVPLISDSSSFCLFKRLESFLRTSVI